MIYALRHLQVVLYRLRSQSAIFLTSRGQRHSAFRPHTSQRSNADLCADEKLNVFDLCLLKRLLIENATYTIRLEDAGEHKSSVIAIVCKYLGYSLNEAKNIVNASPVNITNSAKKADADQLIADLELVGATVSVTLN